MSGEFRIEKLQLADALLLCPFEAGDARGIFVKIADAGILKQLRFEVADVFFSTSKTNVIRGLHYQHPNPQAKLVWCAGGSIFDVIVDLRRSSPTYGKWVGAELSEKNRKIIYAPRGFAHGFLSLQDDSAVYYMCDAPYDKAGDSGIIYNDGKIGIKWPLGKAKPIMSERDSNFPSFDKAQKFD
ncbi:MAG: dTDP-4-dehydrorhamnose 3,5-epimerase [Candidatus Omnitrophota bacterium]